MTVSRPIEPIAASDAEIEKALADAHLPSLLLALAHVTGDLSLLRPELRPETQSLLADPSGFAGGPTAAAEARALALRTLVRFRDEGCRPAGAPDDAFLRAILAWFSPDAAIDAYVPLVREEVSVGDEDLRAPAWRKDALAPGREFRVAIVGAGMSGLVMAHRLDQAGVPFTIFEKNDDVGGTWYDNTYPGCRVDIANTFYSYSFAQRHDWPQHYSTQPVLLDYFRACADELGLRPHIRFGTEVLGADWDGERAVWRIRARGPGGREETLEAHALVSAVGQLNQPKLPDIPGRERFAGPAFHSARWDHGVSIEGKRVAVIGTGASAAQIVPAIAERVAHVDVFQRTPNWLLPVVEYHAEVPPGQRWLLAHVPYYAHWHRFWIFWRMGDGMFLPRVKVDPSWPHPERAVSAANDELRFLLTEALKLQLGDRPDLLEKCIPPYPPASKRILVDNGAWALALKRPNVALVTDAIREIDEAGVVTSDGVHRPADVIVYATGFHASKFLTPMEIRGRGGVELHEHWGPDARAYLGITAPGFPNLFFMYGPNTNIVVNGSIVYFSECEARYIADALRLLLETGGRALDCRRDVHDAFNARVDDGNRGMAWGVSRVNSWYKSETGRISQNWPFTLLEYWQRTRRVDPADYDLL